MIFNALAGYVCRFLVLTMAVNVEVKWQCRRKRWFWGVWFLGGGDTHILNMHLQNALLTTWPILAEFRSASLEGS